MKKHWFTSFSLIAFFLFPSIAWAHGYGMGGIVLGFGADILAVFHSIFLIIYYYKSRKAPERVSPFISFIIIDYIVYFCMFIGAFSVSEASDFLETGFLFFISIFLHLALFIDSRKGNKSE